MTTAALTPRLTVIDHAPRSLASEILAARDAFADATPPQPYRRSAARA